MTAVSRAIDVRRDTRWYRGDKIVTAPSHFDTRGYHEAEDSQGYVYAIGQRCYIDKDGRRVVEQTRWGKVQRWIDGQLERNPDEAAQSKTAASLRGLDWPDLDQTRGRLPTIVAARAWVEGYRQGERTGLYLHGAPGRGKSQLAALILRDLLRAGVKAERRDWTDPLGRSGLVQAMQDSHRDDASAAARELLTQCAQADVLIVDDFGKSARGPDRQDRPELTPAQLELAHALVEGSLASNRPLVVTSNWAPQAFADLGDHGAIASRLSTMLALPLLGPDFRAGQLRML